MSRHLSASDLLQAWDDARDQSASGRAIALLAAATGCAPGEIAHWSIARRDQGLFDVRLQLFGAPADAVLTCPHCGEQLEMALDIERMRPQQIGDGDGPRTARISGQPVRYRLPNSDDLAAIAMLTSTDAAREMLLERCIVSAAGPRGQPARNGAQAGVAEAIAARIARDQAQADIELGLTCPACNHAWSSVFDIAAFLWREVDDWARQTLREVHMLARAYGWREADVLALSSRRRQLYLEMVM